MTGGRWPEEAVLIVNASGTIQPDELPADLAPLTVFTIGPTDGTTPGKSTFEHVDTLASFVEAVHGLFSYFEEAHKQVHLLHVFAAAPVSASVALGRAVAVDNAAPSLAVYHRSNDTYHYALSLPALCLAAAPPKDQP